MPAEHPAVLHHPELLLHCTLQVAIAAQYSAAEDQGTAGLGTALHAATHAQAALEEPAALIQQRESKQR
jgi:hypothetical protein